MTVAILWLRRDLRVEDHPALRAAARAGPDGVVAAFVLDPALLGPAGPNRRRFLAESLRALDAQLGGALVVRRGEPARVICALADEVGVRRVFATGDFGPYGVARDRAVAAALAANGCKLELVDSPYAIAPGVLRGRTGAPLRVFAAFRRAFEAAGVEPPPRPFPRLSYADSMLRYGTDKPDLRFGLEIQEATELTRDSEFGVFRNAPCVRYVVVPRTFSRSEQARLEELAKEWGAKGLANLTQISKFLSERELETFGVAEGSTALFVADEEPVVARVLGLLRLHLAHELGLIEVGVNLFHWITDFPLFEHSEEFGGWTFMHHPFTATVPGEEDLIESDPAHVRGQHYDLIWNGWELGSGSIRIHEVEVQQAVFRVMGMGEEEQRDKFGFLLDALQMGAPPHGGFAMGIDRFIALLAGEPDIRQVTAFPKVASGADPLTGAPTAFPDSALRELGIRLLDPQPE